MLDNIRSVLNVGSILRTADFFNVNKVILTGITPGLENPRIRKTALTAENNIKIVYEPSIYEAAKKLKENGYKIITLEIISGAKNIKDFNPVPKTVLVIGNEINGVSESVIDISDQIVRIYGRGKKESLNVSVATGIALYEFSKF